jgi:phosphodiesterase/alkaline phosphatase D-like protein
MPAISENDFAVIDQTSATFHEPVRANISLTKAYLDDYGLTGHDWPVAVNSSGTTYGDDRVFTSSSDLAIATTNGATCVTGSSVILNATVNPKGAATNVTFEYGLGKTYGNTVSIASNPVSDATNIVVSVTLNGLIPNQVYHYRVVANNAAGTTFGKDATFTTAPVAPNSQTLAATLIKQNSATLNGSVNPQNASTTVSFEYGPDKTYGEVVQYASNPVSGTASIPVSLTLNNLLPQQVYHYRLVATNAGGVTYGEDQTFQTILAPTAVTGAATNVHSHDVTLNATINPQNTPATVSFEYGLDDTYGETVLLPGNPFTGGENIAVNVTLDHLLPNQRYHYRVVGTSAAGTNYGADYTFTTWGNIFLPSIIR